MSTTTTATGALAQGQLIQKDPDSIVLALPGTDYRIRLGVETAAAARLPQAGKSVSGHLLANAKRVDKVRSGGRYIEPVFGRPRRIQGRVTASDPAANTITVWCACPITCRLTMNQHAADFAPGTLVSFDIERGAKFEPA